MRSWQTSYPQQSFVPDAFYAPGTLFRFAELNSERLGKRNSLRATRPEPPEFLQMGRVHLLEGLEHDALGADFGSGKYNEAKLQAHLLLVHSS